MRTLITVAILICSGIGLSCRVNDDDHLTEQEYGIYLVVKGERPDGVIVVDETGVDLFGEISSGKLPEIVPGIRDETINDYARKNRKPPTIAESFPFKPGNRVIRMHERDNVISEYEQHYIVSRVGFSNDGKQAFVRFYHSCEALCGDGAFYLLANINGVWQIQAESEHWKS